MVLARGDVKLFNLYHRSQFRPSVLGLQVHPPQVSDEWKTPVNKDIRLLFCLLSFNRSTGVVCSDNTCRLGERVRLRPGSQNAPNTRQVMIR